MPDEPNSEPRTFLLTPAQHLAMAELVLRVAGQPGGPTRDRALQMARNHRVMAAVISKRAS